MLSPQAALYGQDRALPVLPPCVHFAGSERFIANALALQARLGPVFDVASDCEDGAAVGAELAHAEMVARLLASPANAHDRAGVRVHDVAHPAFRAELEILVGDAGHRLAFVTLPKARDAGDVERILDALALETARRGLGREIPATCWSRRTARCTTPGRSPRCPACCRSTSARWTS